MNHAEQWPAEIATNPFPGATRLKVFAGMLAVTAALSCASLYWRVAVNNALAANISDISRAGASQLNAGTAPAGASATVQSSDQRINRESEFLMFMGEAMFQRGDVEGAAEAFQKALAQSPTSEKLHLKLALCFSRLNRSEEALRWLEEAIHIAPDYAEAHHQAGILFMQKRRFADAADHFEEFTRLKPEHAGGFNGYGLALAKQEKFRTAATNFARAVELNPKYLEARLNLAQVYAQLGAKVEAVAELDRALEINPQFNAAKFARAQLEQGMAVAQ
ncbi:MAG TPA: tetratricopeptide repeat protein [Verrucomicrobiae bacterium]